METQLEDEIRDGVWYLAEVSKEVLFRSRDRLGAKRAKPLWTEIIELLDYRDIRDQLYGEEGLTTTANLVLLKAASEE